jgi:hypothetical protein
VTDLLDGSASAGVFWEAWAAGRLLIQRCESCGHAQFYPRIICVACGSAKPQWVDASGRGVIYSYTVVRRAPSAVFADFVPYVIALVDLEEGPRLMANVIADDLAAVQCGVRVQADAGAAAGLPDALRFRIVDDGGS